MKMAHLRDIRDDSSDPGGSGSGPKGSDSLEKRRQRKKSKPREPRIRCPLCKWQPQSSHSQPSLSLPQMFPGPTWLVHRRHSRNLPLVPMRRSLPRRHSRSLPQVLMRRSLPRRHSRKLRLVLMRRSLPVQRRCSHNLPQALAWQLLLAHSLRSHSLLRALEK